MKQKVMDTCFTVEVVVLYDTLNRWGYRLFFSQNITNNPKLTLRPHLHPLNTATKLLLLLWQVNDHNILFDTDDAYEPTTKKEFDTERKTKKATFR